MISRTPSVVVDDWWGAGTGDELLRSLLRFDTSNPPGGERECVGWIASILETSGVRTNVLGSDPERPNLLARVAGAGQAPPLLLYGHVDVVPTTGQQWSHGPFSAEIADGYVWGRGALDMKGAVAMYLQAVIEVARSGAPPPGDVILALVSDEEAGGHRGAGWLVREHPEFFTGVGHALGEFGGFSFEIASRRFYPIMVAEKEHCRVRIEIHGPGGHGSMPVRGGVAARMARVLARLERPLPIRITPIARRTISAIADALPFAQARVLRTLLQPLLAPLTLRALPRLAPTFAPMLSDTVAVTLLRAGESINVIPSHAQLELDARLLPGSTPADLERTLRERIGPGPVIHVDRDTPAPEHIDESQVPLLGAALRRFDPNAIPIPFMLPAVTDARHFSKLGIQTYGFTPMRLPPELRFNELIHAADERIPVGAVDAGAAAVVDVIRSYGRDGGG